jgi:hypothetical protein
MFGQGELNKSFQLVLAKVGPNEIEWENIATLNKDYMSIFPKIIIFTRMNFSM